MSKYKPVIKWTGSKRSQADIIVKHFPQKYAIYYEPFIGGGSVLFRAKPKKAICGDILEPLIDFWKALQYNPDDLIDRYNKDWIRLQNEGHAVYYEIRDRFNRDQNPYDLLFLSRTCVNGLIRFNEKGDFNNSFHHSRPGIHPKRLKTIIFEWSEIVSDYDFIHGDYRETTKNITENDLVYLDPPYFHTKGRYFGRIDYSMFIKYLEQLNEKGVRYILSYDGKRGDTDYSVDLPRNLFKRKYLISSGLSPFKKVMDKENEQVKETLYLNW